MVELEIAAIAPKAGVSVWASLGERGWGLRLDRRGSESPQELDDAHN